MRQEAYFCTVEELNSRGKDNIPQQLISHTHLIYSSPATLAFNSPGAEGFGVKRAGLAVPDSIMLIVAPGCCGRNIGFEFYAGLSRPFLLSADGRDRYRYRTSFKKNSKGGGRDL